MFTARRTIFHPFLDLFSFIAETSHYKEFYLRETNSIELVTYNCLRIKYDSENILRGFF